MTGGFWGWSGPEMEGIGCTEWTVAGVVCVKGEIIGGGVRRGGVCGC